VATTAGGNDRRLHVDEEACDELDGLTGSDWVDDLLRRTFVVLCCLLTSACDESDDRGEQLEIVVDVTGDEVTIDGVSEAVHLVRAGRLQGSAYQTVWAVSASSETYSPKAPVEATIKLPVVYGQAVGVGQ
jgi:hypothetical protein